jgi:hypothetical protein
MGSGWRVTRVTVVTPVQANAYKSAVTVQAADVLV